MAAAVPETNASGRNYWSASGDSAAPCFSDMLGILGRHRRSTAIITIKLTWSAIFRSLPGGLPPSRARSDHLMCQFFQYNRLPNYAALCDVVFAKALAYCVAIGQTGAHRKAFVSERLLGGTAGTLEIWMKPQGGTMLGAGRTIRTERYCFHRVLSGLRRCRRYGAECSIKAGGEVDSSAFRVEGNHFSRRSSSRIPQHDFPQRIIYRTAPDGSDCLRRIEGKVSGKARAFDYPMTRAKCD